MSSRSNFPMPDNDRPASRQASGDSAPEFEEDPLVELARIVSEGSGGYQRREEAAPPEQEPLELTRQVEEEPHWQDEPLRGSFEDTQYQESEGETGFYREDEAELEPAPEYPPDAASEPAYGEHAYEPAPEAPAPEAYEESYREEAPASQTPEYEEPAVYEDRAYSEPQYAEPETGHEGEYGAEPDEAYAPGYDDGYADSGEHHPQGMEQAPQGDATSGFEDELRSAFDISIGGRSRIEPAAAGPAPEAIEDDFDDLFEDEPQSPVQPAAVAPVEPRAPGYETARAHAPADEGYAGDGGEEGDYYDEEEPPEGGYDLDAVARAMKESDPALTGHGVLPPHPEAETRAAPEGQGKRRGLAAAAAIVGLAVVGGAAFALIDFGDSGVDIGPPPVIAAQEGDLKIYPATEEPKAQAQSKLIYDRVRGVESTGEERLVLPDDTPVASLPPAPVVNEPASTGGTARPVAPKRVRTVIVRPDGTVISGNDGVEDTTETAALSEPTLPSTAREPAAPALPGASTPSVSVPDVTSPAGGQDAAPAVPAVPDVTPRQQDDTASDDVTTGEEPEVPSPAQAEGETVFPRAKPEAPRTVVAAAPATTSQPAPARQSGSGPLDLTSQQQAAAPATAPQPAAPAAPPQPSQPAASSSGTIPAGAYIVQVSSQRTEDQARQAFNGLQNRFPSVLGSITPVIERADLGDRGVFYRVRIPASSRDEAIGLCENLKAAGGDCFVRRN